MDCIKTNEEGVIVISVVKTFFHRIGQSWPEHSLHNPRVNLDISDASERIQTSQLEVVQFRKPTTDTAVPDRLQGRDGLRLSCLLHKMVLGPECPLFRDKIRCCGIAASSM